MTKRRNTYAAIDRAVKLGDREAATAALAKLTFHEKDLLVACPAKECRALAGEECLGEKGRAHFGRRLKRLLEGIR